MEEKETLNRIKKVLVEQGRTQAWLARKIGKSYVVITNYCNNKTQPSLSVLKSIAEALDIDVRNLLNSSKPIDK